MAVKEREAAKFECELSVAKVQVTWSVQGEVVESSPKYAIHSDGSKHTLQVSKCRPKDAGTVTCSYGDIVTEAKLSIERKEFNNLTRIGSNLLYFSIRKVMIANVCHRANTQFL